MRVTRRLDRALLLGCGAVLAATVLYPTARLLVEALPAWDASALRGAGWTALLNTVWLSLASVFTCGVFGSALAFLFTRYQFPGRGLLAALAFLPFTLPPLVGVLAFYYLIGRDGILVHIARELSGGAWTTLPGAAAILLIHTYAFFVFFYSMVATALEGLDQAQREAARTLGAGPWRVFTGVTLPQLRPALTGAALLTFMSSVASFSAPYFFGNDFPMLSVEIYERHTNGSPGELTLTVVLAAVALLGLLAFRSSGAGAAAAGKGVRVPLRSGRARVGLAALGWAVVALLIVPHLAIVYLSFIDYRAWQDELVPTAFTLRNYALIFGDLDFLGPIRNSLWMSAVATVAALLFALPAGYLIARGRPYARWLSLAVMLPWALPGTVIAMNLIAAFNESWAPLYNTVWLLPLAYFVRNVPLLTRVATAAIAPFDARLIEAARTLGASPLYVLRRVVLPLLAPALAAGCALVFATALGEFVASILIFVPDNIPISVQMNIEWRGAGGVGVAFAYSVLLMALLTATFALARRFSSRLL